MINFDANASYGVLEEVSERIKELPDHILNPSSIHSGGQKARALIEEAREKVSQLLSLERTDRVIFCSGATEANNYALTIPFWDFFEGEKSSPTPGVVVTRGEHPSVLEPVERLSAMGISIGFVDMNPQGQIDASDVLSVCPPNTRLVSCIYANNETGQVLPLSEIKVALHQKEKEGVLFHTDAVQALGKVPFRFADTGADMMTLSGHKVGAFPGVGALIVNERVHCKPLIVGGPQETRWRAGTENVPGIVSFGYAAEILSRNLGDHIRNMKKNRDTLESLLFQNLENIHLNGAKESRLPNTINLRIKGVPADDLIVALDLEGIYASAGAACASGKPEPSHVLLAMGLSEEAARESIRLSLRASYLPGELEQAASCIVELVQRFRHNR